MDASRIRYRSMRATARYTAATQSISISNGPDPMSMNMNQ
jgi:hypothetical protein